MKKKRRKKMRKIRRGDEEEEEEKGSKDETLEKIEVIFRANLDSNHKVR